MPDVSTLDSDEWYTLRKVRLTALRESPDAFLSTYEREKDYGEDEWRAEFKRGDWNVGHHQGQLASLLGVTREPQTPMHQCYLEYIWVARQFRRSGVASRMLATVIERLPESGVQTAFLWVLDGNHPAMRLYEQAGFVSTHRRQPLAARPGRTEELLRLDLA
jgi:ribosomal protein S18 acetylase RimI-like enzyme